jgi:hypothetical protein
MVIFQQQLRYVGLKSTIGMSMQLMSSCRLEAAPEFSVEEWPPSVQVQSKHNTPIEGFWRWKREGEGFSIREAILTGKNNGLFNPSSDLHK